VHNQFVSELAKSASKVRQSSVPIHVAVFDDEDENRNPKLLLEKALNSVAGCDVSFVTSQHLRKGALRGYDVIVFPGGNAQQQSVLLGEHGKEVTRDFVRNGGGFVGICAGAFFAASNSSYGLDLINVQSLSKNRDVPGHGMLSMAARNAGSVSMEFTKAGKAVFDYPEEIISVCYSGGPILSPAGRPDLPFFVSLADYRTEVFDYDDQKGTMINTPAIVASRFGNGRVILVSPHLEMTSDLETLTARLVFAACGLATRPLPK
jgi:glutamine amidotransferase-like uncharacterized protein